MSLLAGPGLDDEYATEGGMSTAVLEVLRRVRQENADLKRNFESLKGIHLQLASAHKQLQANHAALHEERVAVEKQYQGLCDSWRLELAEKQRAFEAAKAQILGPRDIELIKVKLMEEVEGPFKHKCDMLAQEAEMAQQNFVRLRREHEELLAQHKNLELRATVQMETMADEHTATVRQLKDKIAELGRPQSKLAALESQLQAVTRERESQAYMLAKLKDENQDLRRQKERAVVEKETAAVQVERKAKDVQAEELQMSGMVESLSRKNRFLQKELAEAQRSGEELYASLVKANSEKATLTEQLDALRKTTAMERQMAQRQSEEAVARLEETVQGLREELHDRECQVAELHMTHQEQVARMVEAHDARLHAVEADAAEKAREARRAQAELQAKVDTMRGTCEEYRHDCQEFKRQAAAKAEQATREAERLQVLAADSSKEVAARASKLAELRSAHDALRTQANSLEVSNGHLSRRKEELSQEVARLQQENKEVTAEKHRLSQELDDARKMLTHERAAQLAHIEDTRQSAAIERAATAKKFQAALREQQAKHEAESKKAKKALRSARAEVVQLTDQVMELKLHAHELEAASGFAAAARLSRATGDTDPVLDVGRSRAGAGGNSAALANLAALQERQRQYLIAAGGSG